MQESVEKVQKELAKQKEVISVQNEKIEAKSQEAVKYKEQTNELQLNVKALEHSISKHQQEAADATAKVRCFRTMLFLASSDQEWLFSLPHEKEIAFLHDEHCCICGS